MCRELSEIILNIYLIIENGFISSVKAVSYNYSGNDEEKIRFLKLKAKTDLPAAKEFRAPVRNNKEQMSYKEFNKFERQGLQFRFFEDIFEEFNVPENPLVCLTPVVNGQIITE